MDSLQVLIYLFLGAFLIYIFFLKNLKFIITIILLYTRQIIIALFTCCLMTAGKAQLLPPPYIRGNLSITIVVRYPESQLTVQ